MDSAQSGHLTVEAALNDELRKQQVAPVSKTRMIPATGPRKTPKIDATKQAAIVMATQVARPPIDLSPKMPAKAGSKKKMQMISSIATRFRFRELQDLGPLHGFDTGR